MANYRAEFCSIKGVKYKLELITNSADTTYQTLTLAGGSSCVLDYQTTNNPFEPIRTSTLSMTFVHDKYLDDLLLPHADDVLVRLYAWDYNSYKTRPEFVGYLNNAGAQNASYVNCLEDITLTANDLLITAQFKKYINQSGTGKKQVVKLDKIFDKLFDIFPPLYRIKWPKTKMSTDPKLLTPELLTISENNFYSSDTDDGWDYQHVIESIARYFGFTALMHEDTLWFIDYAALARCNETIYNSVQYGLAFEEKTRGSSYWTAAGSEKHLFKKIVKTDYMGSNNQISYEPIYNKIKVVDNYYQIDKLIPNILDDDSLIPEYGNLKECRYVEPRMQPHRFVNSDGYIQDDKGENYYYFKREFKSKKYDSHWYKSNGTEMTSEEIKAINGFQVLDNGKVEETVMGTNVWVSGWELAFWDGTKEGCGVDFAYNSTRGYIDVRYHGGYGTGGWVKDVQGNLVPGFSIFVGGSSYDIVNPSFDYDYNWHEYNDGSIHFFYGFNGYYVGIVPIDNPVTDISKWTCYGQVFIDEFGNIDYMYIDQHSPLITYGAAGVYYGDTAAVTSALMHLYLDNSTNEDPKDFTATFTYAVGTAWEVSTTQNISLPAHGFTTLELFTWVNGGQYDGEKLCRINVNGDIQEWTINEVDNPAYANGSNLIRLYRGAKIVDYANFRKEEYENELPSDISFTRYLAISQQGGTTGTSATSLVSRYLPVFTLKEGTAPAVMVDTQNTTIVIDADAIFERYRGTDYINPEWESEPRNKGEIHPALVLTLGIGNKYWDGYKWATGKTAFDVPLQWKATQYVDQDDNKYSKENIWNSDLHVKNHVSWADWTGANGYTIPLNGVDLNGEITFEIRMPKEAQENVSGSFADFNINGMCYISKLDMYLGTEGGELDDLDDVVFENVIDEKAVNEFSPIELDITSYPGKGKMSYSHIGYNGKLLQYMRDISMYGETQEEEANLIERYVHQFCTKTCIKDLDLKLGKWIYDSGQDYNKTAFVPFHAYIDTYDDNGEYKIYANLGDRKDYVYDLDSVHLVELKKYEDYPDCNIIRMKFSDDNYPDSLYNTDYGENVYIGKKVSRDGSAYVVDYIWSLPINRISLGDAVKGNTSLTDLWVPDTIGTIYNYQYFMANSFSGCSNLSHIVCKQSPATPISGNFEGIASEGYLEVPYGVNYNTWYTKLPSGWSGIIFVDQNPNISTGSASTVVTRNFTYVGSSASSLKATSNASWCGTNLTSNGNNSYTVNVQIQANGSVDARTAKITVSDGTNSKYINVSQSAAALLLTSSPAVNSGTTIGFKPDGTTKATSGKYVEIQVITNAPNYTSFSGETWINMGWKESDWTTNTDGLYARTLQVSCDSGNYVSRSGYTSVVATHGNETKEIKMKIAQDGEAKINWRIYQYINNEWMNITWADRKFTRARISSEAKNIVVIAELAYDGIPDYDSGNHLHLMVRNSTSNWAAGPYNPYKFQVLSGYTGRGYQFVPAFFKTMGGHEEPFVYPGYNGAYYCSFLCDDDAGREGWGIFNGTSSSNKLTFEIYSDSESIALTNRIITLERV